MRTSKPQGKKSKLGTSILTIPGSGPKFVPAIPRKRCKPGACPHLCNVIKWCTLDPHVAHYHQKEKRR